MSFGHPGDGGLRERLLAAVLTGAKTATSSLAVEHLDGTPLPRVGEHLALVDAAGHHRGVVVTTQVSISALSVVGDDVAAAEGEGFTGAHEWRAAHVAYWQRVSEDVRASSGDPSWVLGEHEPVVVERFTLLPGTLDPASSGVEGVEPALAPPGVVVTSLPDVVVASDPDSSGSSGSSGGVDVAAVVGLYRSVGWSAYTDHPEQLLAAVAGSSHVVLAHRGDVLVGLARVVSDGASIAYVQDVIVHPDHRRAGVGAVLVRAVMAPYAHVRQQVLLTDDEPSQRAFCESLGCREAAQHPAGPLRTFVRFRG